MSTSPTSPGAEFKVDAQERSPGHLGLTVVASAASLTSHNC